MTEYNPNYEFGGGSCTLMDLREVDREKIRLVKYVVFHSKANTFSKNTTYVFLYAFLSKDF